MQCTVNLECLQEKKKRVDSFLKFNMKCNDESSVKNEFECPSY